jgi:hypothetical protein
MQQPVKEAFTLAARLAAWRIAVGPAVLRTSYANIN